MKLGLGTAQFGMNYGVSKCEGKTDPEEVGRILEMANRNGVKYIDTAALYGDSEEVLGRFLSSYYDFRIVTKTPKFGVNEITSQHAEMLERAFYQSLVKLGKGTLYGLLAHHADDLIADKDNFLMQRMTDLKKRGLVRKIGVSVYTESQIDMILEKYSIDIVQIPLNVLDQRLLTGGHINRLKNAGIEVHARSVFLQGLLLMDPGDLPSYFQSIRGNIISYHREINRQGYTALQAALGFVAGLDGIDVVVCGINNQQQLKSIIVDFKPLPSQKFYKFSLTDEAILNPSKWRL